VARADHGDGSGSSAFVERIAEILGIDADEVSAAITQARSEERTARMESRLAEAVEAGVISEEESTAITDWFAGKPDALSKVRRHGLRSAVEAGEVESFLSDLVAELVIDQSESDEIAAWLEIRPAAMEQLREWRMERFKNGDHGFRHGRGRWGRGFGRGWGHHGHHAPGEATDTDVSNASPL